MNVTHRCLNIIVARHILQCKGVRVLPGFGQKGVPQGVQSAHRGGVPWNYTRSASDLGKTVIHLVGLNLRGEVVVRKKLSRKQLLHFTANLRVELIGMEASGGSHFLGRALREQGHEVRLIPAQYLKPYVKANKSDYIEAEAIAEAVGRPTMRFVPIKSDDQLDMQSLHPVRERWVMRRTAVVNQIRSLLLERGITVRKGRCHLDARVTRTPGRRHDEAVGRSAVAAGSTEAGTGPVDPRQDGPPSLFFCNSWQQE